MIDLDDYSTTHDEVAELERDRIIEIINKHIESKTYVKEQEALELLKKDIVSQSD